MSKKLHLKSKKQYLKSIRKEVRLVNYMPDYVTGAEEFDDFEGIVKFLYDEACSLSFSDDREKFTDEQKRSVENLFRGLSLIWSILQMKY